MFEVDGNNNIYITRGDTGIFTISLIDGDGNPYVPEPEDTIRFAMAKKFGAGADVLVNKSFPADTLTLELEPEDTKNLAFGDYVYDIELTDADGHVSTVIIAKITLTKEVY